MPVRIEGYLVQKKLAAALKELVGSDAWLGSELRVPKSRRRWDMAFRINAVTTVVEFDGDAHYRDPLKMKIDNEKDAVADSLGYRVVRIPYWVQLDNETLQYFFNISDEIDQDFPHGFIITKLFPGSYCELGIQRFQSELAALPPNVSRRILQSLRDQIAAHGLEYVLPSSLYHIVQENGG